MKRSTRAGAIAIGAGALILIATVAGFGVVPLALVAWRLGLHAFGTWIFLAAIVKCARAIVPLDLVRAGKQRDVPPREVVVVEIVHGALTYATVAIAMPWLVTPIVGPISPWIVGALVVHRSAVSVCANMRSLPFGVVPGSNAKPNGRVMLLALLAGLATVWCEGAIAIVAPSLAAIVLGAAAFALVLAILSVWVSTPSSAPRRIPWALPGRTCNAIAAGVLTPLLAWHAGVDAAARYAALGAIVALPFLAAVILTIKPLASHWYAMARGIALAVGYVVFVRFAGPWLHAVIFPGFGDATAWLDIVSWVGLVFFPLSVISLERLKPSSDRARGVAAVAYIAALVAATHYFGVDGALYASAFGWSMHLGANVIEKSPAAAIAPG